MLKAVVASAVVAGSLAISQTAEAVICASLDASTSYGSFTSCTSTHLRDGPPNEGQDSFDYVSSIVNALFGDEGISITESGSYSPGSSDGSEFFGDNAVAGFDIDPDTVGGSESFEFVSLPTDTIFVSIKQGDSFELFRVPDGGMPFTLAHSLGGGSTSHISTFAGTLPPIPLPAAGWLLLASVGGLVAMRRRAAKA